MDFVRYHITPGPWHVKGDDRNGQAVVAGEHIEVATCWHHCVGSIEREMRANALVIAKVPELLEIAMQAEAAFSYLALRHPDAECRPEFERRWRNASTVLDAMRSPR